MNSMSDEAYNKYEHEHPAVSLYNIQYYMYECLMGTLSYYVFERYFEKEYASYYIEPEALEKCKLYRCEQGPCIHRHYLKPLLNVALEIYRYNHQDDGNAFSMNFGLSKDYLESHYKDVSFLENISETRWNICEDLHHYIMDDVCNDSDVIRNMGQCFKNVILLGAQNVIPMNYAEKAAYCLQMKNPQIKWRYLYEPVKD